MALTTVALGLAVIIGIVWHALDTNTAMEYVLGGWSPPLGIRLRADGLSVLMLLAVTVGRSVAGVVLINVQTTGRDTLRLI